MPDSLRDAIKLKIFSEWQNAASAAATEGTYGSSEAINKLINARRDFLVDLKSVD